jgi:DHA3 family macrolide efflux protein-like MFS transporter
MQNGILASGQAPKSMMTFWVIWFGQLVSILGSGLTSFALGVWIFERTGQATPFALVALFSTLPHVLLLPVAGSLADRFNRRWMMILSDSGAALVTAFTALMLFFGELQIWQIYLISLFSAIFSTFQQPAYTASITMLVPKKELARASGMQQASEAIEAILTPVIAGVLYTVIGLRGVILIDAATFLFAVGSLLIVHIPQPERVSGAPGEADEKKSVWADVVFGWNYLRARQGLFGLLWYFACVNFFLNISGALIGPLVLSFGSAAELGTVQMAFGLGLLLGSLAIGAWGGPRRRMPAIFAAVFLATSGALILGLRASTLVICSGIFIIAFFVPFASALSQAVFQTKVTPDLQGRVFAVRSAISHSIMPLAFLLAGPLADRLFEPWMAEGGALSATFLGGRLGVGPGRGIGLIFVLSWVFLWSVSLLALSNPRIRNLEGEIPDAISEEAAVDMNEEFAAVRV